MPPSPDLAICTCVLVCPWFLLCSLHSWADSGEGAHTHLFGVSFYGAKDETEGPMNAWHSLDRSAACQLFYLLMSTQQQLLTRHVQLSE